MNGIGNTPLIRLQNIVGADMADVFVKFEGANLTGSMKDRMALEMIEGAERTGRLVPGMKVVEYTGGSTGSSLAMICAKKGYEAYFVSSNGFAAEKLQTMRAYGAKLELIYAEGGVLTADVIDRMIARTRVLAREENTFWVDQINNLDNKRAYHKMGREIIDQVEGEIDEFVMAVGGGGCISGNAEILKEHNASLRIVGVEPYHVRNISGGNTDGRHKLEGIGLSMKPPILRSDLLDEIIAVKDEDAYTSSQLLAREDGVLGGITSGANIWAALKRAKELGPGKTIVTVVVDTGLKYLQGDLYI